MLGTLYRTNPVSTNTLQGRQIKKEETLIDYAHSCIDATKFLNILFKKILRRSEKFVHCLKNGYYRIVNILEVIMV